MSQTKSQPPMNYFTIVVIADDIPEKAKAIELSFFENEVDVIEAAHTCRQMGIDDRIMRVREFSGDELVRDMGMAYFCNAAIVQ